MHQEPTGAIANDPAGRGAASATEAETELATVRLNCLLHRVADFNCTKSQRVTEFLQEQAREWVRRRYCGVFVLADPHDPGRVLGYYTLSQYVLTRDEMSRKHRNEQVVSNVPLALIGFMGKQDGTPRGTGAALLVDAARRVHRHVDIPAWGIALEPEGGRANVKLWAWYEGAGFKPAKTRDRLMYAPFESLIPELMRQPA